MMKKYFGTDGIRGMANQGNMTAEIAMRVGKAAGRYFTQGAYKHRVVIGKDTRLSGYLLEPALTSGFISMGMDVILLGPMPTPAVAMLTRSLRADLGVMLSASHNQFFDNGIKLFDNIGNKLSDKVEAKIEAGMEDNSENLQVHSESLGRASRLKNAVGRYIEFSKNTFPKHLRLEGLKIVLDCANGAAYRTAPAVLWELGADVITIGVSPNGTNINKDCGSTDPKNMCDKVVEIGADIGIALDGDADRLIVCDEKGHIINGDQVMAALAGHWHHQGQLKGGAVVSTVMSNLGLEKYINSLGLAFERTSVGDRYVVAKMQEIGCNVGGEQSGHIILSDFNTTGDGLVAALQLLSILIEKEKVASILFNSFDAYPQYLENIRYPLGDQPLENKFVKQALKDGESLINGSGRLLVRKSGTEPVIRVMVEGPDVKIIKGISKDIVDSIRESIT